MMSRFAIALLLLAASGPAWADDDPAAESRKLRFFEARVRPVLVEHCYACHSAESGKSVKGGLTLDTREGIRQGGEMGPAVVPGDPSQSLLIQAVRHDDEGLQMPPKGKLPAAAIADLEAWVKDGAIDPRESPASTPPSTRAMTLEESRHFWAFQPPKAAKAPAVADASWPRTEIDRFLLAALETKGLKPVGDADRRALIRRATFDLIGLPPTPDEVRAFRDDSAPTPEAFAKVVDRLLDSPRFGERWGRHWLDVARYAESAGKEQNLLYPFAWRYRDYVIDAFNADKPYDRFLKEQIAGDLMPTDDPRQVADRMVATGYLAIGPKSHNTQSVRQFRLDLADEQIDAFSQGMLGMTFACARCHDHKFDPVSQKDYYALAGILLSSETRYGTVAAIQNRQPASLVELPEAAGIEDGPRLADADRRAILEALDRLRKARQEMLDEARDKQDPSILQGNIRLIQLTVQINLLERKLTYYRKDGSPRPLAVGMRDREIPFDVALLIRGELDKPGEVVPRALPPVVAIPSIGPIGKESSGRLELADWIASRDNPLTARVMANRVWLHLFGGGIVTTPDNFGTTGQPPTNPDLLDHLATSFMADGWSIKSLIRRIANSRAYQLASTHSPEAFAVDPENSLNWRMSPRRLEAEAIRDAMLAASGQLEVSPPVASPVAVAGDGPANLVRLTPSGGAFVIPPQLFGMGPGPNGQARPRPGMGMGMAGGPRPPALADDPRYRSVYLPVIRDQVPDVLAAFDFAEPSLVVGSRESTTVPSQALFLLNSPFAINQAIALADRLMALDGDRDDRIREGFERVLGRNPSHAEIDAAHAFLDNFPDRAVKPPGGRPAPGDLAAAQAAALPPLLDPRRAAWTTFCQSLFAAAEFRFVP